MYHGGYTAEITRLSPKATEKDVDFLAYCGSIQHVGIIRCMNDTAYQQLRVSLLVAYFLN
ncbi:hypothetical protein F3Y22_tig00110889pilonHSYRG00080 [Hibiscus syriacus]|uniref:Uncharacterized protein n=1 Tax=Hibiscus syriacus TaxID=106335 RepID=A0A6A2ZIW5_HIBSY|nr:hypothetical protein F3Y22_tig00110889pilonHSYRG00080 [Hibiscus syriacus]